METTSFSLFFFFFKVVVFFLCYCWFFFVCLFVLFCFVCLLFSFFELCVALLRLDWLKHVVAAGTCLSHFKGMSTHLSNFVICTLRTLSLLLFCQWPSPQCSMLHINIHAKRQRNEENHMYTCFYSFFFLPLSCLYPALLSLLCMCVCAPAF